MDVCSLGFLEAWFFALGTFFILLFRVSPLPSLVCIQLLGNIVKVDESTLDLEWFFFFFEKEEKNKGNFVCLQLQQHIIATSHAHNFLPLTCVSKLNFYALTSQKGVCVLYRTISYQKILCGSVLD